jgi:aspartate/methionine/tyrosine aminotransferase
MMTLTTKKTFQNFDLETYQALHEHNVELNLADSSVKCVTMRELLTEADLERLLSAPLMYPMVNGSVEARTLMANMYPDATAEHILVTVGASEATQLVCQTLLGPHDEVVVISPGYRQVYGLALNLGCHVKELHLKPEDDWRPDLDELEKLVTKKTKLIAVVNPNNPTGTIFTAEEMKRIVGIAAKVNAYLHADEVYRGSEREKEETPSFWNTYDKAICTNSLSKAYGLSGLRIGWIVAERELIKAFERRHEYAVISASSPSMMMAEIALQPEKRKTLVERQRNLAREGWDVLRRWLEQHQNLVSVAKSEATALGFVGYHLSQSSHEVAEAIRTKANVLVAPGQFMGEDKHLRITLGYGQEKVAKALDRIADVLKGLQG